MNNNQQFKSHSSSHSLTHLGVTHASSINSWAFDNLNNFIIILIFLPISRIISIGFLVANQQLALLCCELLLKCLFTLLLHLDVRFLLILNLHCFLSVFSRHLPRCDNYEEYDEAEDQETPRNALVRNDTAESNQEGHQTLDHAESAIEAELLGVSVGHCYIEHEYVVRHALQPERE